MRWSRAWESVLFVSYVYHKLYQCVNTKEERGVGSPLFARVQKPLIGTGSGSL